MKNKNGFTSKDNGFVGQFKSLDINEMSSLRGGVKPPSTPPTPGDDFPIPVPTTGNAIGTLGNGNASVTGNANANYNAFAAQSIPSV